MHFCKSGFHLGWKWANWEKVSPGFPWAQHWWQGGAQVG